MSGDFALGGQMGTYRKGLCQVEWQEENPG